MSNESNMVFLTHSGFPKGFQFSPKRIATIMVERTKNKPKILFGFQGLRREFCLLLFIAASLNEFPIITRPPPNGLRSNCLNKNLTLRKYVASKKVLPYRRTLGLREGAYDESTKQARITGNHTASVFEGQKRRKKSGSWTNLSLRPDITANMPSGCSSTVGRRPGCARKGGARSTRAKW